MIACVVDGIGNRMMHCLLTNISMRRSAECVAELVDGFTGNNCGLVLLIDFL
jgi:hypothetical protein